MSKMEPFLTGRFEDALVTAAQLHSRQTRKGSDVPYVSHLLSVAGLVLEHGGDEDEAIAALLHDAVEDQGGKETLREIGGRFGERVAQIVQECSDTDEVPKPPWRERKEAYIEHLARASASARLISAADKLHNVRATLMDYRRYGERVWERFHTGRNDQLWYYRRVANVLREYGDSPLTEELHRVVSEMEALALANDTGKC